ncbi:hypothetical protein [Brevibacillus invocatus]|uniref:hypothetical protein n=1 Tax=Brevibacillus TaxID=55080 RepID=UPI0030B8235D
MSTSTGLFQNGNGDTGNKWNGMKNTIGGVQMDSQIFEIVLRSILAFSIMMIIARILGKPTISQLTYHDFVVTITLGALTANLTFNTRLSLPSLSLLMSSCILQ